MTPSELWSPPRRVSLSEWAIENYRLSSESSVSVGRFRPYPFQIGILDAVTDPSCERVTVKKSARVGATKILNAATGYYMAEEPSSILTIQPTEEDARGYSKEEITPMLRDVPVLRELFEEQRRERRVSETIQHKMFPGGVFSLASANTPGDLRRLTRRIVSGDELDSYPQSSGIEGNPWILGCKRSETAWNRKLIAVSTPLMEGTSAIHNEFEKGDQRYFLVPCPHCGYRDKLIFSRHQDGGHWMKWPEGQPEEAYFVCFDCGAAIEKGQKEEFIGSGQWVASKPYTGHASFHIWAAYSYSPNATWAHIASEFLQAKAEGTNALKTFVNTTLGETWKDKGEAPDYQNIFRRRESYRIGSVPEGVDFLTCGVDVQKDRFVYEVVGWREGNRESWSIEADVIYGDTAKAETFNKLDELLEASFEAQEGTHKITTLAIDSGYQTQGVYNWARRYPLSRVLAVKGMNTSRVLLGTPSKTDVNHRGKKVGYKVWPVGSHIAKGELYGWLRLEEEEGGVFPPGYCHFPEYAESYFLELTAEHLIPVTKKTGHVEMRWEVLPNRENHFLDCRVYARAAASLYGMDRRAGRRRPAPPKKPAKPEQKPAALTNAPKPDRTRSKRRPIRNNREGRGRWI